MCAKGLRAESTVRLDRRFSCFSSRGLPARLPNATGSELNGCARTTHPGRFTESRASPASVGARFHEERHIFSRRERFFVFTKKRSLTRSLAHPPRAQSVSAYFEYDGTASLDEPAFVHLQFITWIDCNGIGDENERSARCMCVTLRVSTTSSAVAYARAVHLPTASLLAARRLMLEAHEDDTLRVGAGSSASSRKNTGASVARIEKCVSRVAEAFSAGADSSPAPFPEALVPFAEAMYHLRRGPMLGVGFGHDD